MTTLTDAQAERLALIETLSEIFDRHANLKHIVTAAEWILAAPEPEPKGALHNLFIGEGVNLSVTFEDVNEDATSLLFGTPLGTAHGTAETEEAEVAPYVPQPGDRVIGSGFSTGNPHTGTVLRVWSDGDVEITSESDGRVVVLERESVRLAKGEAPVKTGPVVLNRSEVEALPLDAVLRDGDGDLYVVTDQGILALVEVGWEEPVVYMLATADGPWFYNEMVAPVELINAEHLDGPVYVMSQEAFDTLPAGTILLERHSKATPAILWKVHEGGNVSAIATNNNVGEPEAKPQWSHGGVGTITPAKDVFYWASGGMFSRAEIVNPWVLALPEGAMVK